MSNFEHPMGGWDIKAMSDQLDAVTDTVSAMALELETLKIRIAELTFITPPTSGGVFVPRNRRT